MVLNYKHKLNPKFKTTCKLNFIDHYVNITYDNKLTLIVYLSVLDP